MIKRAAAISLIILANTVLLAVSVVPHHHHGEMICFVGSHCHHGHDSPCCHHDAEDADHGHGHSNDANCCKVGEWLLPNVEPEHRHQHHCFCTTRHSGNDLFIAVLPDFSQPIIQPVRLPFRQTPTGDTILQTFVSRVHGLRAPPFDGTQITRV